VKSLVASVFLSASLHMYSSLLFVDAVKARIWPCDSGSARLLFLIPPLSIFSTGYRAVSEQFLCLALCCGGLLTQLNLTAESSAASIDLLLRLIALLGFKRARRITPIELFDWWIDWWIVEIVALQDQLSQSSGEKF
jgi:hypothetical protein